MTHSNATPPSHIEKLYEGRHLHILKRGSWEYAHRPNASGIVGIIPITNDGRIVFIEQHRPPINNTIIELPAGLAGDIPGQEDEALELAAQRELLEETGYEAERMIYAFEGTTSAGLTDERVIFFLATGLTKTGPGGGDDSEDIQTIEVPINEAASWLSAQRTAGKDIDLKVYAGLYFAERALRNS